MLTHKQDIIVAYDTWIQLTRLIFNIMEVHQAEEVEADEDGCMYNDVDDDVVQEMLDLINVVVI